MANFKYDIVTFIELVEQRPCLWDKTHEHHKNKVLRDRAWREIIEFLEPEFLELTQEEKKRVRDSIISKWTHIRDAFFKSRRTKTGQGAKKSYIYAEYLQFLLRKEENTESNFSEMEENSESELKPPSTPMSLMQPSLISLPYIQAEVSTSSGTSKPKFKRTVPQDAIEREIPSGMKRSKEEPKLPQSSYNRPDEKEMMLLSFLPYIKDMTELEMMDFQIETLNLIKKIKNNKALHLPENQISHEVQVHQLNDVS